MANTTIALRSSGTAAATPSLGVLANGELSINYADGIIYYKTASNTLGSIRTTQPAGLTTEIQFNDAGTFGSNSGLIFDKSTGYFKAPIIESTNNGNGTNFKVGDDTWIGDVNIANTLRISGQQDVNNAYIIFGASDAKKLGRAGTGALTYEGNFVASGELSTLNSSGDEGGQVNFAIPQTNSTLNGGVVIDVFRNSLRFYESGGTNRGAYIDLTAAGASVGTNLLTGGGAVTSVAGATGAVSNNQILAGLLTVDGAGSGLDADLLDGLSSASFANAAFANTDYTTISATAAVYGNASHVPVVTLTANGRVSSITNTAISIASGAVSGLATSATTDTTNATNITTGTLGAARLPTVGTAGTYANASFVPVITTDAYGRVSSVTNTAIALSAAAITSGTLAVARGGTGVTTSTGSGSVVLNTSPTLSTPTVDRVDWPAVGYAPPSLTTRSSGTKLTLYPSLSSTSVDYAIGINGGVLWSSIPAANNSYSFKWYGGESEIASLSGSGEFNTLTSNVISTTASTSNTTGALKVAGGIGVKGNVSANGIIFDDGTRQTTAATGGASIGDVLALSIALG